MKIRDNPIIWRSPKSISILYNNDVVFLHPGVLLRATQVALERGGHLAVQLAAQLAVQLTV